jgi:hypothetical protein
MAKGRYGNPSGASAPGGNPGPLEDDVAAEMAMLDDMDEDEETDPFLSDAAIMAFPELDGKPERIDALVEFVRSVR